MKVYEIEELFEIAKSKSPFYKELYKNVSRFAKLSDLPVLKSENFWKANTIDACWAHICRRSSQPFFKAMSSAKQRKPAQIVPNPKSHPMQSTMLYSAA